MAQRPTAGVNTQGTGRGLTMTPSKSTGVEFARGPLETSEQKTQRHKHDLNYTIIPETRVSLLRQQCPHIQQYS